MEITHEEILEILRVFGETTYDEIRLEIGDFKFHARKRGAPILVDRKPDGNGSPGTRPNDLVAEMPSVSTSPSAVPNRKSAEAPETNVITKRTVEVRAPMLGTFYRRPSPEARPFVEVGDMVRESDTVCLIEVMKLFNSIPAGTAGKIVKILAEEGQLVEFEQPLMLIEPEEVDS